MGWNSKGEESLVTYNAVIVSDRRKKLHSLVIYLGGESIKEEKRDDAGKGVRGADMVLSSGRKC